MIAYIAIFADVMKEIIEQALQRFERERGTALNAKVILFDMDGVLYDSMPAHERSWLETAERYDLPMTAEDVYMFEGQTGGQTIEILIRRRYDRQPTAEELRDIYALKTELFNQYNTGSLIANVKCVLEGVKAYDRVIVTGSSQAGLLDKLDDNFPGVFSRERMITGLDVERGKPNPEPYLKGMALVEAEPWQSIVVENAPSGVRAAADAGCFVIAVNTGPLPDERLWEQGAHLVLPDMMTLREVFVELF